MYVLIHGGFHNNKCWHDVEQILRKNGKKVTSVLLPGHNETDIERLKDINVTACVESIINQIGETDEKLTLVFHSMAGIFIYDTYKKIGKEQIERNSGKNAISLLNRGLRTRKKKTGRKQRNLFRKNWWI